MASDEDPREVDAGANSLVDVFELVGDLLKEETRERALLALRERREEDPNLAVILWHASGAVAVLIQEVVSIYTSLQNPRISPTLSGRVCNAMTLLQCLGQHDTTRELLVEAQIPIFVFPILATTTDTNQFKNLRLGALGIIGSIVRTKDSKTVKFLLRSQIVPICFRIMELERDYARGVATFVVHKLMNHDIGVEYICGDQGRFSEALRVLESVLKSAPSQRLLKTVIRCYLRIAKHPGGRMVLSQRLPTEIVDNTFADICDYSLKRQRVLLLMNLGIFGEYNATE